RTDLSGGEPPAYLLAMASSLRGTPIPSFTVSAPQSQFDETDGAVATARAIGSKQTVLDASAGVIAANYARLIQAAESPVLDTSCAALLSLSREVHKQGNKVVITGEGADEAFAGYLWFKWREPGRMLDVGQFHPSTVLSRIVRKASTPHVHLSEMKRIDDMIGGPHA